MLKPKLAAAIFVLLIATAFAYGRTTEGVLGGIVLNSKGAPVAAAQVFWQTADGKTPHAVRTDATGHFRIAGLRERPACHFRPRPFAHLERKGDLRWGELVSRR